jgi:hypothetical protein
MLENGCHRQHVKDYSFEIKHLSTNLGGPAEDVGSAYGMCNLNHIFKELGMPWAPTRIRCLHARSLSRAWSGASNTGLWPLRRTHAFGTWMHAVSGRDLTCTIWQKHRSLLGTSSMLHLLYPKDVCTSGRSTTLLVFMLHSSQMDPSCIAPKNSSHQARTAELRWTGGLTSSAGLALAVDLVIQSMSWTLVSSLMPAACSASEWSLDWSGVLGSLTSSGSTTTRTYSGRKL